MRAKARKPLKPLLVIVITIALVFTLWPAVALAAPHDGTTLDHFQFNMIDSGADAAIVGYDGTPSGALDIPDTVDASGLGYSSSLPVIMIGGSAFHNCTGITSLIMHSNMTTIGISAFIGCTGLQSISWGGVQQIDDYAFEGCSNSAFTSVAISNSVSSIGVYAFAGCTHLTSVDLPANPGFTATPDYLFIGCVSLTHVTFPSNITALGNSFGQTAFTTFTIASSITTISADFSACANLANFSVDAGNTHFSSSGGVLYSANGKTLIAYPHARSGAFSIPSGVTTIGDNSFFNCSALTGITIPDSVTEIQDEAFLGCSGLTSVTIPSGVASIDDYAFGNTTNLMGFFVYSDSVSFGSHVFAGSAIQTDGRIFGHDPSSAKNYANAHQIAFEPILTLTLSPSNGQIYTGGRITITPNVDGGDWTYDHTLLSLNGNEFTGLKAGTAHVTYDVDGQSASADVVIRQAELPSTGQDFTPALLLLALGALTGGFTLAMLARKRRRQRAR